MLDNKNYLTIGTRIIAPELMCPPFGYLVVESYKPSGGIWTTEDRGSINANPWLDYLSYHHSTFYQKYNPNGVKIELKDNANILIVNDISTIYQIQKKYPIISDKDNTPNKLINYHNLAKDYDGIFISRDLIYKNADFKDWCVSTLVLFNINVIKQIKPFTLSYYEDYLGEFEFEVDKEYPYQEIKKISDEYLELFYNYNKEFIKSIQAQRIEKIKFNTYWEFNESLRNISERFFKKRHDGFERIAKYINENIVPSPIENTDLIQPLTMQLWNENYDYINDIYTRNLKR